jgi:PIN domain nuclease of toxin-antitoxin system
MKLLIDTHVLIWTLAKTRKRSRRAAKLLADGSNEVLVSAGSAYEIEFKRGRNVELNQLPADLRDAASEMGFSWLPISSEHAVMAGRLPRLHGDPFDRIIIAQALVENATVLSCDGLIAPYGVPVLW